MYSRQLGNCYLIGLFAVTLHYFGCDQEFICRPLGPDASVHAGLHLFAAHIQPAIQADVDVHWAFNGFNDVAEVPVPRYESLSAYITRLVPTPNHCETISRIQMSDDSEYSTRQ